MMMEVVLSEEKAEINNYDIDECYNKIDKYFISRGVKKTGLGFYKGTNKDFSTFAGAQAGFPNSEWFLKVVDQWYISYFGDTPDSPEYREDALKTYYQVKEQVRNYVRKQKGSQF